MADNQDIVWHTSFADIQRSEENLDYVEKLMKEEYFIEQYLVGSEIEPRHHFHICAKATKKTMNNLLKKLAGKFNLFQKGQRGGVIKYGVDRRKVMDLEQHLIYCTKQTEGDTANMRASFNEEELTAYFEKSYIVKKKNDLKLKVLEYMDTEYKTELEPFERTQTLKSMNMRTEADYYRNIIKNIKLIIINYLRKSDIINISRGSLNMYCQYYFNLSKNIHEDARDYLIYYLL